MKQDRVDCPDCKKPMELIVPNNAENYWKCPKCRLEEPEEGEL